MMSDNELESTRSTLINLFTQKVNAHISYLLATALATIGVSYSDILKEIHFSLQILFIMAISAMVYFLGRAMLYSILSNALMYVVPYTPEEFEKAYQDDFKKRKYNEYYSFGKLYLLQRATFEFAGKSGKYKNRPTIEAGYTKYIVKLFTGRTPLILLIIFNIILVVINYILFLK